MAVTRECSLGELEKQLAEYKEHGSVVEKAVVATAMQDICKFIRPLITEGKVMLELTKRDPDRGNELGFLNFSTKAEFVRGTIKNTAVGYTLVVRDHKFRPLKMWNLICSPEIAQELFPDDCFTLAFRPYNTESKPETPEKKPEQKPVDEKKEDPAPAPEKAPEPEQPEQAPAEPGAAPEQQAEPEKQPEAEPQANSVPLAINVQPQSGNKNRNQHRR